MAARAEVPIGSVYRFFSNKRALTDALARRRPARELLSGFGRAPEEERLRAVLVCVETADAVLRLAFRSDPEGDPDIITETRHLLRAYLARLLD
ncbi:hypothetical protein SCALM49S_05308 [Streptomyces californicus]